VAEAHSLTTLDSGVRIVTEAMPSARSAALGFFIGTGSSTEDEPAAGWSHLLEHMLFRGTASYASDEIDRIFDAMGAELNAGTGKESTSVYARVLDDHLERAFDVMADMVWRPRIAEQDLANEREIVLEEIAMYEDDPQDLVFDLLGAAVFGGHPLGRPVIGTRETVSGAQAGALQAFHHARYVPQDIVVAAAGSVDHEHLAGLVRAAEARTPSPPPAPGATPPPRRATGGTRRFVTRPTEQVHVALGGLGLARDDPRRYTLRVLDAILGGTSSSRLFQEIRERRGLAYQVFSFHSQYAGTGQVGIYLGTRPENLGVAVGLVGRELRRLLEDGITGAELQLAKDNAEGRLVLGLESTSARMSRLGGSVLAGLPLLSVDALLEHVEAVSAEDVVALAGELFAAEHLSAAAIGPDEDAFRAAVAPALPALAEAA
jgi:predicted Zn-dependent peptidase